VFAAAAVDAVGCIQLLCAKGANPDAPNVHGVTPLQMAAD
jgi:ankyrin repeat protein